MKKQTDYISAAIEFSNDKMLTVTEFVRVTDFPIDIFAIDKFWNTMEEGHLIYVDDELLQWMGYESAVIKNRKQNFLKLLGDSQFEEYDHDAYEKYISNLEYAIACLNLYPSADHTRGKNRTKHILLSPKTLKLTMMKLNTNRGDKVREYYIALEDLFKLYVQYQRTFESLRATKQSAQQITLFESELAKKDLELARAAIYSNNIKSYIENVKPLLENEYVYVATTLLYASCNQFKIGRTTNLNSRISVYNTGRPEGDRYFYTYTHSCTCSFDLEKRIATPLKQWRDAADREMYVLNYDKLIHFIILVCEHDHDETAALNEIVNSYNNILMLQPSPVVPLLTWPGIQQVASDCSFQAQLLDATRGNGPNELILTVRLRSDEINKIIASAIGEESSIPWKTLAQRIKHSLPKGYKTKFRAREWKPQVQIFASIHSVHIK